MAIKPVLTVKDDMIVFQDGSEIDYLVIGSGPAGSLIAYEILENDQNARVVIMDSGSFLDPEAVDASLDADFIESNNLRTTDSGGIVLRNANVIGGGSTINIDLAFSPLLDLVKRKLGIWIDRGVLDASLIHGPNQKWDRLRKAYDWVKETIGTRQLEMKELNRNNHILLSGTPTAKLYDLNQKPFQSENAFLKNSTVSKLLLPAVKKHGSRFGILSDTWAEKIEFERDKQDNRRASAVVVKMKTPVNRPAVIRDMQKFDTSENKVYRIKAKKIIMSAGTLGSTGLLLRSNIKNHNIGRGIVIHPSMGMVAEFNDIIDCHTGLSASVYAPSQDPKDGYIFESMGDVPSFLSLIHPGSGTEIYNMVKSFRHLGGFGIMLVDTPSRDNRVYINDQGVLTVHYTLSSSDADRMRRGLMHGVRILFEQGAKRVYLPSREIQSYAGKSWFVTYEEAQKAIQKLTFCESMNFISSAHMQGSNKLALSGKEGVISPNFKLFDGENEREIPNVYIMDSSIFPTSVGANPMQSIYALAKLAAEKIMF